MTTLASRDDGAMTPNADASLDQETNRAAMMR
jgi:hypothetical protein